jgi:hypothetical protein
MNALFTAIYTRWAAAMGGRTLYNTVAIGEATYPYATVSIVGNTTDDTFTEDIELYLIQFDLFSDTTTCEEIGLAFTALKAAFDKHALSIVGYTTISLERGNANISQTEQIWHYITTFKLKIQKD